MTTASKVGADDFIATGLKEEDFKMLPRQDLAYRLERKGDDFVVQWPEHKVECLVTALLDKSDGPHGELTVTFAGTNVHWARIGLASSQAREGVVRKLREVSADVPWRAILEVTCRISAQALREPAPTESLSGRLMTGPRFLI